MSGSLEGYVFGLTQIHSISTSLRGGANFASCASYSPASALQGVVLVEQSDPTFLGCHVLQPESGARNPRLCICYLLAI